MSGALLPTVLGVFTAWFSERGLVRLVFPSGPGTAQPVPDSAELPPGVCRWREDTSQALERVLSGQRPGKLPPFDLGTATPFQRRVWTVLQQIGPGTTRTYAAVAAALGRPQAARAVGQACGANPIPLLIPCHRVVAAGGGLGGFSAGLKWKRLLLAREGIELRPTGTPGKTGWAICLASPRPGHRTKG